jgi:predicted permease
MKTRTWIDGMKQDLRFAMRQLIAAPGFLAVAILTVALGTGATTAVFSAMHAVVLAPLPFPGADRIAIVATTWRGQPGGVSVGNYDYIRERARSFDHLAAVSWSSVNLAEAGAPERVLGARVTWDFFPVFGAQPQLGRLFSGADDRPGHDGVVVLSHRLWKRRFGGDPAIVGRDIRLDGVLHQVIGVTPTWFDVDVNGEELWLPAAFTPAQLAMHDEHYLTLYGRLAAGVTLPQAQGEAEDVVRRLSADFPKENTERGVAVTDFGAQTIGDYEQQFLFLLAAVGLVLLVACVNVANLLLARGAGRTRELAVRAALGAGRARLAQQLLTESVLVSVLGTAVGLAIARWAVRAIIAVSPIEIPRLAGAGFSPAVFGFAAAIALFSGALFGTMPALQAARHDVQRGLGQGDRTVDGERRRDRARGFLVGTQAALVLILLAATGMLVRSLVNLRHVDLGFEPRGVLTGQVTLPRTQYADPVVTLRSHEQIVESLRRSPNVEAAAASSQAPLGRGMQTNGLVPEGRPVDARSDIDTRLQFVTADYFRTLRIRLRAGRGFLATDRRNAPPVMIVNETFARQAWPGQDPVGKRVACCEAGPGGGPSWKTVVGVAPDVRSRGPAEDVYPEFYLPMAQVPPEAFDWVQGSMTLVVRATDGNAAGLAPTVRRAVRDVDSTIPVYQIATMTERWWQTAARPRFNVLLISSIAAIGLVLAAVGTYGVVAYFVSRRRREIGLRIALGATRREVVALVLRQGLRPLVVGTAAGTMGAALVTRLIANWFFGILPGDPASLVAAAAVLVVVGALACVVPARRAARVDPVDALRET